MIYSSCRGKEESENETNRESIGILQECSRWLKPPGKPGARIWRPKKDIASQNL
jgi:hypothetical protein